MDNIEEAAAIIADAMKEAGSSGHAILAESLEAVRNQLHVSAHWQVGGRVINIVDAIDRGSIALENIAEELSRIADYLTEKGN